MTDISDDDLIMITNYVVNTELDDNLLKILWEEANPELTNNLDEKCEVMIVRRLVEEIQMLRGQKYFVRLAVDYDESDCMIPSPFSAVTEEGHEDLRIEVGKSAIIAWDDAETETRVRINVKVERIEVE